MRFQQHATARSPLPTAFSPLQSRSLTTAGSRQPLLIASGTPLQKCVSCRCNGCVHHGWLTPAALGARCSFAAKALFAMDKRTFTGAAGVSPPWLGEPDAVPRESNIVQQLASTRAGAAGVSPLWLGNVLAVMNAVCERERSPTTAGLPQPLLIASGTPLQKCVSCRCNGYVHHGWLTPAALGARCSFAAKALFAMDKRTFTGAAGVSLPWLGERDAVPRESNIVQRLASTRSGAAGVSPPWLGERDAVPRESNIVQRLASTRSGAAGVSPPWLGNVLAVMNAVCERERSPTTAGSRQPLLVHSVRSLPKRYLRWTNAHSQERRASARRGSVNRTLCRENRTLSSSWRAQEQERRALACRGSETCWRS
jgi:hypothetical protein